MEFKLEKELKKFAQEIRISTLECIKSRGFGHVGGSLSIADTLAVLYGEVMNVDSSNPKWEDRDKLVCSKGHAGPAVYATLALRGFFPYKDLLTLNQPGTNFPSHCDRKKTPGVDMTTGSLGQGTSLAVGIALGDKVQGRDSRTFLICGDGELNEGQVWEAAMFTAAKKVNNLVWIIDNNKRQLDGSVEEILNTFDIKKKFEAFGFEAIKVKGDDVKEIYKALTKKSEDKPIAVILDSIKGRGIEEIETNPSNHSMNVAPEVFDSWITMLKEELDHFE